MSSDRPGTHTVPPVFARLAALQASTADPALQRALADCHNLLSTAKTLSDWLGNPHDPPHAGHGDHIVAMFRRAVADCLAR